ncbi:MAG: hypothetical protein AMJ91_00520 [candidate division Zixibacteria bacterium SM23_73_3]|nr:MAG: hypothetical protein AMJ91_00520 [candidate division Zixibacteria bacterium SM23_73_3]
MKKRVLLLVVTMVGVLVLVSSSVYAQPPCPSLMDMADELGLTDGQVENIREIQYNFKKTEIGLRAELKTSRLELRHLMMKENPSQKEIGRLVDRIAEAQKKVLKQNVDRKLALKEILTPEQFEKFIQMKRERGKGKMGRGPKFPPHRQAEFPPHGDGPGF